MTKKLYDLDSHIQRFEAQVLSCQPAGDGKWQILLDQTAFFPEGGGQPADPGALSAGETEVRVLDIQESGPDILHTTDGPLPENTAVTGVLDWAVRHQRMQCHSGEHIISGLAHRLYGCTNVGFHMGDQETILDFDKELSADQLETIENLANQIIAENRPITAEYPDPSVLKDLDYRSKLDLTENVRIVTIPDCDVCACCAPHVHHTGEVGLVKFVNSMRHRGGVRLWMVAGRLAVLDYQTKQKNIAAISAALSVKQEEAAQGVDRMKQELQDLKQTLNETRKALAALKAQALTQTEGNLVLFENDLDAQGLRTLVNVGMEKCTGVCAAFTGSDKTGYRCVMGSQSVDLRAKAKEIHGVLGGKGGGQPTMIQGTVTAARKDIEAYFR